MSVKKCWKSCCKCFGTTVTPVESAESSFVFLDEDEIEVSLPSHVRERGMSVVELSSVAQDRKNIYTLSVKAMMNFLGQPIYPFLTHPNQLYSYILFLCGHEIANASSKKTEPAELKNIQLTVFIKDAKIVHPKYSDFSRVFCKLWIKKGKEVFSSVKDTSIDLIWDELFLFDVEEYERSVLTIEVWSSRPRRLRLTYTEEQEKEERDISKKDIYKIGEIAYFVKDISCLAKDLRLPLKRGPRKMYTRGELSLFLKISTKKSHDHVFQLHINMEIWKLCYEKQLPSLKEEDLWKNWLEVLPKPAVTLLQQHAIQNGITQIEQCVCSWLIASSLKINKENRISFEFLHSLLDGLISDTLSDKIESHLEETFYRSIDRFAERSMLLLGHLHQHFEVLTTVGAKELYYLLRCMSAAELTSQSSCLNSFEILSNESLEWYLSVVLDYEKKLKDNVGIDKTCSVMKKIVRRFLKNHIILDDIFQTAWSVSYSSISFNSLDKVFTKVIKPVLTHIMEVMSDETRNRAVRESLQMLQLYHSLRNLVNYVTKDLPSERANLCMEEYTSWFGEELILEWFLLCDAYTFPYIKRAVLSDNMKPLSKAEPHGTSIKDISTIIDEMVLNVWTKLNWNEQFNTHKALLQAVRACVMSYATELSKRITSDNLFCGKYSFFMNSKLCVALNNAYFISELMNRTKRKIRNVLKSSKSEYGSKVKDSLSVIEVEIHIAVCNLFLCIFNQIQKQFSGFTTTILLGFSTRFISMAIADTCSYMESILELLYTNLKSATFYIVLRHLWLIVVINIRDGLSFSKGWAWLILGRKSVYMRALQTLTQLGQVFYCDGQGLSYPEMRNLIYEELKEKIEQRLKLDDKMHTR